MSLLARVRAAPRLASRANTTAARAARAHGGPRRRPPRGDARDHQGVAPALGVSGNDTGRISRGCWRYPLTPSAALCWCGAQPRHWNRPAGALPSANLERPKTHVLINIPYFVLSAGIVVWIGTSPRGRERGPRGRRTAGKATGQPHVASPVRSSACWNVKHGAHRTRLHAHDAMNGRDCLRTTAKDIERGAPRDESQEPRVERLWTDDG